MTLPNEAFHARLQAAACRALPGAERIEGLVRLSAGATLETWSFDAVGTTRRWPLILRRSPGGLRAARTLPLADEAALVRALRTGGAMVAEVVHTLVPEDDLGDGFIMIRIPGETIPRKILLRPFMPPMSPCCRRLCRSVACAKPSPICRLDMKRRVNHDRSSIWPFAG
jgi:aminoglycoside phosphotransferase (APT) family kinase protein